MALLQDQLGALDAWNSTMKAMVALELAAAGIAPSPETGLRAIRRVQARRIEQNALSARADDQLRQSPRILELEARAVIGHRNAWFRSKVTARLAEYGITVVASFDEGASAFAAVLLDQPDLLLVESVLPLLRGTEVIARAREFAPKTLVGAQAVGPYESQLLLDAGARAVFTRSVPPFDVADELATLLFNNGWVATGGESVGGLGAEHSHSAVFEQLLEDGRRPAQRQVARLPRAV